MTRTPQNLVGMDYRAAGAAMAFREPIIDIHTHIHGAEATKVYAAAARAYNVRLTYTQTRPEEIESVKRVLGERVRFVAIPNFTIRDKAIAFGPGFLDLIRVLASEHGSRMMKLWNAPRTCDWFTGPDRDDYIQLDGKWRVAAADLAVSLGMMIKTHTGDPDTWFNARYTDRAKYGLKREHYRGLEVMLKRYSQVPWIAAHMGGSPEDLVFLDQLLERHANLHLDTSATKWIVRELSKHPHDTVLAFFEKWQDRIIFGSDIVSIDDQLVKKTPEQQRQSVMSDLADSPESAFDLYASRYFALRTMLEGWGPTGLCEDRPSPIADPDLKMCEPSKYDEWSSPTLRGFALPREILEKVYYKNAERVVIGWERGTWKANSK